MTKLTIDIGIAGLTNVMALPYSADRTMVWNGAALISVDTATPVFVAMPEVLVNSVGSGNYAADLPSALESVQDTDGLWISIYDTGNTPSVSDPLYGYIAPTCQYDTINAIVSAISGLEITIDPATLKRALEGTIIQPERVVLGPCKQEPVNPCKPSAKKKAVKPLGFNL